MTIASELEKTKADLAASYAAAGQAGATLPTQRNFDNLPATIEAIDAAEASGVPPLTMKSVSDHPARDYRIYGNSVQGGTPTPDNPQEIKSVGDLVTSGANSGKYRIPITVSGKNLFSGFQKGIGINSTNGSQFTGSTAAATGYIPVNFQANSSYRLSGLPTTLRSFVAAYNADRQFLGRSSAVDLGALTLASDGFPNGTPQGSGDIAYLRITSYAHASTTGTIDDIDGLQIQLEVGSATTSYEPYHIPETTNIILDEPLRKISDHTDYIDFKNQKVVRGTVSNTYNGSEDWAVYRTGTENYYYQLDTVYSRIDSIQSMSNKYLYSSSIGSNNTVDGFAVTSSGQLRIRYGAEVSLTNFKASLQSYPLNVVQVIEPTEHSVSLPSLPRWAGTVTIGVDTKVQPSEVFVKF